MRDRLPTPGKENRVKITQDDGTVVEGVLAYADDATQEGSPYTKGNVLPDYVCDMMDLDYDDSEPEDAFLYLSLMQASVYGKIVIKIQGLSDASGINFTVGGNNLTTDSNGEASIILAPGNYTANFTGSYDLSFSPSSFQVTSTKGKITHYTANANESSTTQATFTSSTSISFSSRVRDFDIFCVGGGGAGGAATGAAGQSSRFVAMFANGGAGGKTATTKNVTNTKQVIQIVIGAGGTSVTSTINQTTSTAIGNGADGRNGGETYVSIGGTKRCSAAGGEGGTGAYDYDQFRGTDGANGGSGSGATGYKYLPEVGNSASNGGNGESTQYADGGTGQGTPTTPFGESGAAYSPAGGGCCADPANTNGAIGSPGSSGGAANVNISTSYIANARANQGSVNGAGGGGAIAGTKMLVSGTAANLTAISGAGRAGLVIIRWRYN